MDHGAVDEALAQLRAGVDALLTSDLAAVGSAGLTAVLAQLESERRRLDAVDVRVVAEVEQRGVAGEYARTTTAELLTTVLRITPAEARQRTDRARDLGPRRA